MTYNQPTKLGVTADWFNEIVGSDMVYDLDGLGTLVEILLERPMRTYEERKLEILEQNKNNPDNWDDIERGYVVTDQNRDTVRIINHYVRWINSATQKGTLTDKLYIKFRKRLMELLSYE